MDLSDLSDNATDAQAAHGSSLATFHVMVGDAKLTLQKAQDRYKTDYDNQLRFCVDVHRGD